MPVIGKISVAPGLRPLVTSAAAMGVLAEAQMYRGMPTSLELASLSTSGRWVAVNGWHRVRHSCVSIRRAGPDRFVQNDR